jgi:hypothetical protein
MTSEIVQRKKQLEARLAKHGIVDYHVTFLPYLDFDEKTFATPYETGCRMLIFYAGAYVASEPDDRQAIVDWLKSENLWEQVSFNEQQFFIGNQTDEGDITRFSWQTENAYILAWALHLINETPSPTSQITQEQLDDFMNKVPQLGTDLGDFLSNLKYRETTEIYDENLFYELATSHFRDLRFTGKEDTSDIESGISYIRHKTLNWLRRFQGISDWDETITST